MTRSSSGRRWGRVGLVVLLVLLVFAFAGACMAATTPAASGAPAGTGSTPASTKTTPTKTTPTKTATQAPNPTLPPSPTGRDVDPASGLAVIAFTGLPPEADAVIAAIDTGGPFDFDQDGTTFQNREGTLPAKPKGYYREFTVPTPGSPDRGARRIVLGREGEMYYTDDHYASFRAVHP